MNKGFDDEKSQKQRMMKKESKTVGKKSKWREREREREKERERERERDFYFNLYVVIWVLLTDRHVTCSSWF